MSWTHSSKVVAVGVLLAVALGTAGIVAGVSFDGSGVPDSVEVGEEPEFNVSTDDPFADKESPWTIEADSDLDEADITIVAETVDGDVTEASGEEGLELSSEEGVNNVRIHVANGEVPPVQQYNYEDPEQEEVTVLTVSDASGTVIDSWSVHRYTEESREARQAIDDASDIVADEGGDSAQERLDEAIVHYNNGEFDSAITAAEDAENQAQSGGELMRILLIVVGALVVLGIVGGGVYYWRQSKQDTSRLQ